MNLAEVEAAPMRAPAWTPSADVVSCDLDGEAALLDLRSGTYFTLNRVGAVIWDQIAAGATREEIVDHVLDRFDVSEHVLNPDLDRLIGRLMDAGLITNDGRIEPFLS